MQLVLSNNRIIAHGENFLAMCGTVINTETGKKYENATIAECDGCPSDIDKVGYEYHAGVFVPCAPYGKGNNNGYFMEVCADCATPRSSGIPIKKGIKLENLNDEVLNFVVSSELLWENAIRYGEFPEQTITLPDAAEKYKYLYIQFKFQHPAAVPGNEVYFGKFFSKDYYTTTTPPEFLQFAEGRRIKITNEYNIGYATARRAFYAMGTSVYFSFGIGESSTTEQGLRNDLLAIPHRIYGVKL